MLIPLLWNGTTKKGRAKLVARYKDMVSMIDGGIQLVWLRATSANAGAVYASVKLVLVDIDGLELGSEDDPDPLGWSNSSIVSVYSDLKIYRDRVMLSNSDAARYQQIVDAFNLYESEDDEEDDLYGSAEGYQAFVPRVYDARNNSELMTVSDLPMPEGFQQNFEALLEVNIR